jgi:hypothetical protein
LPHQKACVFIKRILVGWLFWAFKPEVFVLLWLKAAVIGEAGRAPFEL